MSLHDIGYMFKGFMFLCCSLSSHLRHSNCCFRRPPKSLFYKKYILHFFYKKGGRLTSDPNYKLQDADHKSRRKRQ